MLTFKTRNRGHETETDHMESKGKKNNEVKFSIKKSLTMELKKLYVYMKNIRVNLD